MLNLLALYIVKQTQFQIRFGQIIAWGFLSLVLLAASVVILRYGFDSGSIALQETVIYNHAILFMLGMAYTLQQDKHVRVDVFYSQMTNRKQRWVNFLGTLFFALPTVLFVIWASQDYILTSWRITESSAEAGGLAYVYLLKTMIWFMSFLLLLQTLSMLLENGLKLFMPSFYDARLAQPLERLTSGAPLEGGV